MAFKQGLKVSAAASHSETLLQPLLSRYLFLRGDLSCHQQPEQPFGQGLCTSGGFGQQLLAFGDAVATETDALQMWQR